MNTVTVAPPPSDDLRFVAVRVNLLPDEVAAGRRTDVLRRRVLIGLGGLLAAIVLAFGFSWWQTHSATNGLRAAESARTELEQQSRQFAPLIAAKADTATIRSQLRIVLADDVSWHQLLRTVRAAAPTGVSIDQVDGTSTDTASTDTASTDPASGVGAVTLTGTAPDKDAVADFADALSRVKGLGSAQPTNTATADGRTSWTISVPLTRDALRATSGGK